jgi:hypothetical protein
MTLNLSCKFMFFILFKELIDIGFDGCHTRRQNYYSVSRTPTQGGGLIEKLLDTFEKHLQDQGLETAESQIIDATIIPILT